MVKKVIDNCVACRKVTARKSQQIITLPPEQITPTSPFEFTTMDLFEPYEARDEIRKKVRLKVWGVVFSCMASRAINADIVSDQSAERFLLAYQRFTALRGHPKKLWSDPGKNFVGAKPALPVPVTGALGNEAAKHGTEWNWSMHQANSPHRNGTAKAAVHIVERVLYCSLGGVFTWGKFQTFLYMAANLASERPIDARTQSREDCIDYISPNSLLLGRTSRRTGFNGDPGGFELEGYYKRLRVIQTEVDWFWRKWSQLAGPNLFVRSKWHTRHQNIAVGDIVWLADQNTLRG